MTQLHYKETTENHGPKIQRNKKIINSEIRLVTLQLTDLLYYLSYCINYKQSVTTFRHTTK
jgi:hypothetical protein